MVDGIIKLKISSCVEGDVEKRCYLHTSTNATKTITTTQAKGSKIKLSRMYRRMLN